MDFSVLGVDGVKLAPPDDKVYTGGGVSDDIVFVPKENGSCTKASVSDGVVITETP